MPARLKAFLRLRRARTIALIGMARLIGAVLRGRVDEVWIGDSHSALLNMPKLPFPGVHPDGERRWIWHLGPRVMFSIARDDFPAALKLGARILGRIAAARGVTWVFSFGEIDIRCHLAARIEQGLDPTFVTTYIDRVTGLVSLIGADEAIVVVPVPPAVNSLDHVAFPVVGSPEARVTAHTAVRGALLTAAATPRGNPQIRLLDLTEELSELSGLLSPEFTDDGCHTNDAGRVVARRGIEALLSGTTNSAPPG